MSVPATTSLANSVSSSKVIAVPVKALLSETVEASFDPLSAIIAKFVENTSSLNIADPALPLVAPTVIVPILLSEVPI